MFIHIEGYGIYQDLSNGGMNVLKSTDDGLSWMDCEVYGESIEGMNMEGVWV